MPDAATTTPGWHAELNSALAELRGRAGPWAQMPVADKRQMLARVHSGVGEVAEDWVRLASQAKGLDVGSALAGEEWISGPWVHLAYTGALGQTLDVLDAGHNPLDGRKVVEAPEDRLAIPVLPYDVFDRLLLNGFSVDVWTQPGVTLEEVRATAGVKLLEPDDGGVALVLGAGNISSIAPLDALYKLYAANRVVLLKLNPVNDYLKPVLERIFEPFIELGFLRIVTGGAEVGAYLVGHEAVDELHMTGSEATHDAIVFGVGEEGRRRKADRAPLVRKPITSELGCVSPVIVLPGAWSEADLRFQAEHIATQKLHNSGFNCIAAQVVVLPDAWDRKQRFVELLREATRDAPARPAYYPGANDRHERAVRTHSDAELLGGDCPRTLLHVPSTDNDEAFTTEYFGPTLALTELPAPSPERFLDDAVSFANEHLRGTLGANLIADPTTLRRLGPRLEQAVAGLRYGTIGINAWTGVGYLTPRASWGAFPGHALEDIQSGAGVVHNALLLDNPERTVVRGPFRPAPRSLLHGELTLTPRPPWFVTNRTADLTGRRLTHFAANPRWRALPGIFASALRG